MSPRGARRSSRSPDSTAPRSATTEASGDAVALGHEGALGAGPDPGPEGAETSKGDPALAPAGTRQRLAWFHCFAGIAGDMALGSLLDAGADLDEVRALVGRLGLDGFHLAAEPALRGGIAATRVVVTVTDSASVRRYTDIVALVDAARLPPRVARRARAVFAALADAEARLHGQARRDVHLHEAGGHDAIVDVVGTAAALEVLDVDVIEASPVAHGSGTLRAAHGLLPNPPPAVVRLLEGVPSWGRELPVELTTPTGAAILAALSSGFGPLPAMRIEGSGFGAGSRDLDELPNCTQVVVGTRQAAPRSGTDGTGTSTGSPAGDPASVTPVPAVGAGQPVTALETNVDDATGEQLAHTVARLLECGAHDAWLTPIVMKKGRPATTVHALCDPVDADSLRRVLREETGSLGIRGWSLERWPAARTLTTVEVEGHPVRVKVAAGRVKAEHEDVARAARAMGQPLREVARRAETTFRATHEPGAG